MKNITVTALVLIALTNLVHAQRTLIDIANNAANVRSSAVIAADRGAINLINETDLITAGGADLNDPSSYTSLGNTNFGADTIWTSRTTSDDADDAWVAFNLGGSFNVGTINIFNIGNQQNGYQNRGVNQMQIYYRNDSDFGANNTDGNNGPLDTAGWTLYTPSITVAAGPDGATAASATAVTLGSAGIQATHIAFDITSNRGSTNGRVGLNEVQFFTTVPEPSAYALLAGITALASIAARRRR